MYDLEMESGRWAEFIGLFPLPVPLPSHLQHWAEWGTRLITGWFQGSVDWNWNGEDQQRIDPRLDAGGFVVPLRQTVHLSIFVEARSRGWKQ